jgi:beta-lactamase class A
LRKTFSIVLLASFLSVAAQAGQGLPAQAASEGIRNAVLEQKLRAAVAKASGAWGISVRHVERNEFAGINADQRFQMASVFKIPVLVELYQQVKEGRLSLEDRVEWGQAQSYFGSGILVALDPGLKPTIHDLATLMVIVSDNAATDLLCKRLGFSRINARMRELGLEHTRVDLGTRDLILQALGLRGEAYRNLTSEELGRLERRKLSSEVEQNQRAFLEECPNCGTPREITMLLEKLLRGQVADQGATREMLKILSLQQFNERLPRWLPYDVRVDHKTGTLLAPVWVVNDAGIIYLPGGEHVVVSVFSRGLAGGLDEAQTKAAISAAEGQIAEIGKLVFDYYTAAPRAESH